MNKSIIVYALMGCVLLCGCNAIERKHQVGAAVELNGHYLYRSTLDSLTMGMSSEDSIRATQQYISQWAKDILLYEQAKVSRNPQIDALVEDYRRTLYVHAYEEYLVEKRMPKEIPDSTVGQLYEQLEDRFVLNESIVKGMLIVVPNDAPKLKKLRQWLDGLGKEEQLDTKLMDEIEKYAYQNACGYELFSERWLTTTELLTHVPVERAALEAKLKQNTPRIELNDSSNIYMLLLTDKYLIGQAMPVEYARPEIEKIILGKRQVDFLQQQREALYNEAIKDKKIIFYE